MAYYSSVANDMTAVRQALIDACVSEGWEWNASQSVLSRDKLFVKITHSSTRLDFLGRSSLTAGDMPRTVGIRQLGGNSTVVPLTWPMTCEVYVFSEEVFLLVNYSVSYYQFAAFGRSTVQGLIGTGLWVTASAKELGLTVRLGPSGKSDSWNYSVPAPFFRESPNSYQYYAESFVHTGFMEGVWGASASQSVSANPGLVPMLSISPNSWNSEAVLLPMRVFQVRAEKKVSLVADINNARYIRIDNYDPQQVILIGGERWKVYPFYSKNTASRDGGEDITHSGTLGWAIRYDGP